MDVVKELGPEIPIVGVPVGLQLMARVFGGNAPPLRMRVADPTKSLLSHHHRRRPFRLARRVGDCTRRKRMSTRRCALCAG